MTTFLENWAFSLTVLIGFALAGGFAIIPFYRQYRFAILMAPFAGILLVTLGSLSFYSVLRLPMLQAGLLTVVLCLLATFIALFFERQSLSFRIPYLILLSATIIVAIETLLRTTTSIQMNGAAILYTMDGADHLTYANMADWLNAHLPPYPVGTPINDPKLPYESMPNLLLRGDPRFGSYGFLALVSLLLGQSGAFSYDMACNITLAASILALAAMFSKTRLAFFLLSIGLLTCHWFDWSYGGYFGKINGYPSIFFVAGLFCTAINKKFNTLKITILLLLTAGATIMFSGQATALFLLILGFPVLAMNFFWGTEFCQEKVQHLINWGLTLFIMIVVSLLSSGVIARPLIPAFPSYKLTWDYILPRLAELETHGVATWGRLTVSGLTPNNLQIFSYFTVIIWIILAIVAFLRRNAISFSFMVGPMLLLMALVILNTPESAYQMIGTFYPLALCGATNLIENNSFKIPINLSFPFVSNFLVIGLIILVLTMRQPRFFGMVSRYCLNHNHPVTHQFSQKQIDNLATLIGKETVDIDMSKALPQFYYFVLVELGRRNLALQWSPDTWKLLFAYRFENRSWSSPPTYPHPGTFRLTMIDVPVDSTFEVVYKTNQYQLLRKKSIEKKL